MITAPEPLNDCVDFIELHVIPYVLRRFSDQDEEIFSVSLYDEEF
jgi:hypothetical protein